MTVKELIEQLQKFDPEAIVGVVGVDTNPLLENYVVNDVIAISGSSNSSVNGVYICTDF